MALQDQGCRPLDEGENKVRKGLWAFCEGGVSQDGVVPEDADGLGAVLGVDQAELDGDGLLQGVLEQLVVIMDRDTDHRRVDDRTLRHPAAQKGWWLGDKIHV